jgi:Amt family ammonium transporter
LFFGWFGFNPGSALGIQGAFINLVSLAAVNTLLAGAAGGLSAMIYMWLFGPGKRPDPSMSVNGILAGWWRLLRPALLWNRGRGGYRLIGGVGLFGRLCPGKR